MVSQNVSDTHFTNIIIGGGFSGLFIAKFLQDSESDSFLLVERRERNIGGFALWGDLKIGLLPAGNLTASYFDKQRYEKLSDQFISEYRDYIKEYPVSNNINFEFPSNIVWKNYTSCIFTRESISNISKSIYGEIKKKVYFSDVKSVTKAKDIFYVTFSNGETISCNNLIIASGRDDLTQKLLLNIGEQYYNEQTILAGFRAEFEPVSATTLSSLQLDFKVKSEDCCQTYCFNHKGHVKSYFFDGKRIYCGSLDQFSSIGNTFIGKKIKADRTLIRKIIQDERVFDYSNFKNGLPGLDFEFIDDIRLFMKYLEEIGLSFSRLFFPAMEQFWPRPVLLKGSLESKQISNLYYVGDSTGISFGFLQCYITARILSERII